MTLVTHVLSFFCLPEHVSNGFIHETALLWAEGTTDWVPLSSIPELHSMIPRTNNNMPGEAALYQDKGSQGSSVYLADSVEAPEGDDDFTKFQKEVREAELDAFKRGVNDDREESRRNLLDEDAGDRPSTPPDGEEEFVDDDGTVYKWDRSLRAWVPQVGI